MQLPYLKSFLICTRRRIYVCAALVLIGFSGGFSVHAAQTQLATAGPSWTHEQVQRPADPAVRFGVLPNGMRYALQHNETPKDGVSMRLRIGSGSMHELDGEEGLAHFLEHMAFRGSDKLADGDVVHMLQRQGLAFGPDTNAFTAHDQTVYHFNFPKADAAALSAGLLILREVAGRLKLDPKLVEQEKGVVLSEERASFTPARLAQRAQIAQSLAGTLVPNRWPIGTVESIQSATAEKLRRYYNANYRPDNATLVIVGNINVDAVEGQIREQFADWAPAGKPQALPFGQPKPNQQAAEIVADGLPDVASLTWLLPADKRLPTLDVERDRLVTLMAVSVLNIRLADRSLKPASPILQALAQRQGNVFGVAGRADLIVASAPEKWADAMDAVVTEVRQAATQGVTAADLQRVLPQIRSNLQAAVSQSPTRKHADIADALIKAVHDNEVASSAQQDLALAEPMLASIKPEEVSQALQRDFGGSAPLLFRSARAGAVGTDTLSRQLSQAMQRPLEVRAAAVVMTWPYIDFGAASAVTARQADAETGSTSVTFANGTRLFVRSSALEKDKVQVQVLLGQGRAGLSPELAHALWAMDTLPLGGTGQRSVAELVQWLQTSGKQLNIRAQVRPHAFALVGDTRPADLLAQLQVLGAYVRDAAFRPELGDKLQSAAPMVATQIESSPAAVFAREVTRVMTGGDPRLAAQPTSADLAKTKLDDISQTWRGPLAEAVDVVIVGDISVDAAITAVQSTLAAGQQRQRAAPVALRVKPPAEGGPARIAQHAGRKDQAVMGWHWALPDYWHDPKLAATAKVAAAILRDRLVDTVRSQLGITYSPGASSNASMEVADLGSFSARLETPPEKFEAFRQLLQGQLKSLAEQAVSADELQRALKPIVEGRIKAEQTNGHWNYWLALMAREPRARNALVGEVGALQAVTSDDIRGFFKDRISGRLPIEVEAVAK